MALKTVRGQAVALYPAGGRQTERKEHGKTYRLCQILPPVPQRFEWIQMGNILEIPSEERDRLRRTLRPQSASSRLARIEGRIEITVQEEDMILQSAPAQTPKDRAKANRLFREIIEDEAEGLEYTGAPVVTWTGDAASQEQQDEDGRQAA